MIMDNVVRCVQGKLTGNKRRLVNISNSRNGGSGFNQGSLTVSVLAPIASAQPIASTYASLS